MSELSIDTLLEEIFSLRGGNLDSIYLSALNSSQRREFLRTYRPIPNQIKKRGRKPKPKYDFSTQDKVVGRPIKHSDEICLTMLAVIEKYKRDKGYSTEKEAIINYGVEKLDINYWRSKRDFYPTTKNVLQKARKIILPSN